MCGIAGIYRTRGLADDRDLVGRMSSDLKTRGPDGEGLFASGPVTLGHRRLAILDLSDAAAQPMASHSGRFVVTFNGEIYNYRELAAEMPAPEGGLRTRSDTEVLLLAWELWGPGCLDRLVGQWAFAMYDRRDEKLWLARDRFGEKPLYYHVDGTALAFASSIRALLRAPWISREVDPETLAEYLTLRYVVSPRTVLRDVLKLQPGHFICQSRTSYETHRWWAPRFRKPAYTNSPGGRRRAIEEFGCRLGTASRRCLVSDVPTGLLLSDGIDSNAIQAALSESGVMHSTHTYKARSTQSELPDSGGGQSQTPKGSRVDATYAEIGRCVEPAYSSMTEPIGDGALLATYLLIRSTRQEATVFLCGHGGDELLGGYRLSQERFRIAAMRHLLRLPMKSLDPMVESYTNGMEDVGTRRTALIRSCRGSAPAAARYLVQRPLPYDDLRSLFAPHPIPGIYLGVVDRLYAECSPGSNDLDRIQEVMLRTFLSENLLPLADSAAMACSAELRLPYLDRDLVDLVFTLPAAMRISSWPGLANTKRILRWWAKKRVSEDILLRRKRGFRFGNIRALISLPRSRIRDHVMGSSILRHYLDGLEAWTGRPVEVYRRGLETTYWSLLAFAVWSEAAGIR